MKSEGRSRIGMDVEEALTELGAHIRGEGSAATYIAEPDGLTPERVQAIRRKVAKSTKDFERVFGISARTIEAYEQGRRRPDAAVRALLRVIDREPEAVRRALDSAA
ncbi:helix-turn-helix domain-containing protein [uncultured Enterovirga sp.]|uniref:helix-turn-helix domain-containing protein n=1 Tax=uncultured Enterovirga sp. TaxID=2026352 RepID=UPI0035CB821C